MEQLVILNNKSEKSEAEMADKGIPETLKQKFEKQHYKIVGRHSAVKLCHWTKSSLKGGPACYKQKFYGIKSHRCMQMTTNMECASNCTYCWRSIEATKIEMKRVNDNPKEVIEGSIDAQKKLLSGFKGYNKTDLKKWVEAQRPTNVALSLVGEPIDYEHMAEMIEMFHSMGVTTFLVTTGQYPKRLEALREQQPYQLYISIDAPDAETYMRVDRPQFADFWERHLKSLDIMRSFSCRKVCRITAVKGENMHNIKGYIELIKKGNPNFVEIKGYSHLGDSQSRLTKDHMPSMQEVRNFALKIAEDCEWKYKDEDEHSRVVLLAR